MKTKKMENFLNDFTMSAFGRRRSMIACVICGSKKINLEDFKDEISIKEFYISRMCQKCQDKTFG